MSDVAHGGSVDRTHPEGSRGSVTPPRSVPTGERSNTSESFALGAMAHVEELPEYARRARERAIWALNTKSARRRPRDMIAIVSALPVVEPTIDPWDLMQALAVHCGETLALPAESDRRQRSRLMEILGTSSATDTTSSGYLAGGRCVVQGMVEVMLSNELPKHIASDDAHERELAACREIGRALLQDDLLAAREVVHDLAHETFGTREDFVEGVLHYSGFVMVACASARDLARE